MSPAESSDPARGDSPAERLDEVIWCRVQLDGYMCSLLWTSSRLSPVGPGWSIPFFDRRGQFIKLPVEPLSRHLGIDLLAEFMAHVDKTSCPPILIQLMSREFSERFLSQEGHFVEEFLQMLHVASIRADIEINLPLLDVEK